jgi:hypothetical protein
MTDVANEILHNPYWDHESLFDHLSGTIEAPNPLPPEIPFHPARDLAVSIPENATGYIDIYIDDNLGIVPELGDNCTRMSCVLPLAIHSIARPVDLADVIPRKEIISMKKFQAEGRLEETKRVLGWDLNTRSLRLSLLPEKLRDWSTDILKMIRAKKVHAKSLESTIGGINHVACILHPMRHYMGHWYQALHRASHSNGNCWTALSSEELADFNLTIAFLQYAAKGVSINNLVCRKPTKIYRSDASEFGLGGYNITSGIGWRLELPVDCRLRTSLNSLEFLSSLISIWMDHFYEVIEPEDCILSQTDSSATMGWLKKSNFADKLDQAVQLATARKLADIIIETESCLYSQWFPGDQNNIADSLSRDFHIEQSHLCTLLLSRFPEQAPFGLVLLPVPPGIVYWLTCLLRSQPPQELWSKEPMRSKFALGLGSNATLATLVSLLIPTSTVSPSFNERRLSVPSLTPSEKADFVMEHVINPSSPTQSEPPWTTYHRPLSWGTDPTLAWTEMGSLYIVFTTTTQKLQICRPTSESPTSLDSLHSKMFSFDSFIRI